MTTTPTAEATRSIHNPAKAITASDILSYLGQSGTTSNSGIRITPRSAMTCSPVWSAVDLITSDVAKLPIPVKRLADDGRTKTIEKTHPVHRLLNRWTGRETPNIWVSRMLAHALLYGNSYSEVLWSGSRVRGLHWYRRDQVEPYWEDGQLTYLVAIDTKKDGRPDGETGIRRVPPENMFHLQGLTLDEYGGLSIVDFARQTIGRHLAGENYTDDFFSNDATPSGFFEHPGEMSEAAQERFLTAIERRHRGAGRRHRLGILEEDMKFNAVGVSPKDALLVELLDWGVKDVARFFNIPPHKLGDSSRANYNSLEMENKAYFDSTLGKWVGRIEAEANYKLFLDSEIDDGLYAEMQIDRWNRADTQARFAAYAVGIQWGIFSRNEVRQLEGLNPYDGGDEYLTPATHTVGTEPAADDPEAELAGDDEPLATDDPMPAGDDERSRALLRDVLVDRLSAAARLIGNAAGRAAKRERNFMAAINELEQKHGAAVAGMIDAAVKVAGGEDRVADVSGRLFERAVTLFVEAAECQPDWLASRVADAGERLKLDAIEIATDLIYPRV